MTNNGTSGHTLTKNGFNYLWAGAKANKGAKGGKVGYELKVNIFEFSSFHLDFFTRDTF